MITNFIASLYHDAKVFFQSKNRSKYFRLQKGSYCSRILLVFLVLQNGLHHSLDFDLTRDNNIRLITLLDTNFSIAVDGVLVIAAYKQLDVLQNRFPHFIRQLRQVHFRQALLQLFIATEKQVLSLEPWTSFQTNQR